MELSREMRVYGGSERTEGLSQEETASRGWFTLPMMTTLTACRYSKRWVLECERVKFYVLMSTKFTAEEVSVFKMQ